MKPIGPMMAAVAAITLISSSAFAACPETTGSIKPSAQQGMAKDGTHAPLENSANSQEQTSAASSGTTTSSNPSASLQKDGQTMPLANAEGGGDKNLATSQQDVQAQQKGDPTAMAKAEECKD
jgi:hypothetical protein